MPTPNPIQINPSRISFEPERFDPSRVQRAAPAEIHDCICFEGGCGDFLDKLRAWAAWFYRLICCGFGTEPYADIELYDALSLRPAELFSIPSLKVRLSKSETFILEPDRTETCRAICEKLVRELPRMGLRSNSLDLPRNFIDILDDILSQSQSQVNVEMGLKAAPVTNPLGPRETFDAYISIESDSPLSLNFPASAVGWIPSCPAGSRTVSISKQFECSRLLDLPRNPWQRQIEIEISKELDPVTIENRQFDALQNVFETLFKSVDNPRIEEVLEEGVSNERVLARSMIDFFNSMPGNYRRPIHFSFQNVISNLPFPEDGDSTFYQEVRLCVNRMVGSFLEQTMIDLPEARGGWEFSHECPADSSEAIILCRRRIRLPNAV